MELDYDYDAHIQHIRAIGFPYFCGFVSLVFVVVVVVVVSSCCPGILRQHNWNMIAT